LADLALEKANMSLKETSMASMTNETRGEVDPDRFRTWNPRSMRALINVVRPESRLHGEPA